MAEIRIEKRKPVWPWILATLLLLIVAGVIIFFTNREDVEKIVSNKGKTVGSAGGMKENSLETNKTTPPIDKNEEDCVDGFNSFAQQTMTASNEAAVSDYTQNGLEYLSCSLDAILGQNNMNDETLSDKNVNIFEIAKGIKDENQSHPSDIKKAFSQSAELLEKIQQRSYPDLKNKISEIKTAAKNFRADEPIVQQKESMEMFFEKASEITSMMRNKTNLEN